MALTPTVGESTSNLFLSTMQITSKSILHHGPRSSYRVYYVGLIAAALVLIAMLDRATGDAVPASVLSSNYSCSHGVRVSWWIDDFALLSVAVSPGKSQAPL